MATDAPTPSNLQDLLDRTAWRIAEGGTQGERAVLETLADLAEALCPGAAAALVDWSGTEVSRQRAYAVLHRALHRSAHPADGEADLDLVSAA